ncbi:hypothetical protein C8Q80DRAFT_1142113 [Daedaleopsis nitida]|nr:hypothetical protein C8Q80DRAFT_1142113 [Daedaleopsis nitida]
MPAASSSRPSRNRRRAPSSDIEDDGPSLAQPRRQEEDVEMEDEEEQPRRSRKGKKEKKKRAQQDDSDADVAEEEEEDIPIPEIPNQPLDKNQAQKMRGFASDWASVRDKGHVLSYNFIKEIAASVAEFTEGEKSEKAMASIDRTMRELLDTEQELTLHEKTLDDIYQKLARGQTIEGITSVYRQGVQDGLATYNSKTSRQKYAKSDHYQKFKQAIYEVHHPDTAMPPVVDLIPREDGDVSDDEDDLQVGGVTQDYKCPLSLTHLVDPLTSRKCGHSYSDGAIRDYLGPNRNRVRVCPATGCRAEISLNDLQEDKDLAKRAKEAARRERAREHDSEDDELIE